MEIGIDGMKAHAVAGAPGFVAQLLMLAARFFRPGAVQPEAGLQQHLRLQRAAEGIAFIQDARRIGRQRPSHCRACAPPGPVPPSWRSTASTVPRRASKRRTTSCWVNWSGSFAVARASARVWNRRRRLPRRLRFRLGRRRRQFWPGHSRGPRAPSPRPPLQQLEGAAHRRARHAEGGAQFQFDQMMAGRGVLLPAAAARIRCARSACRRLALRRSCHHAATLVFWSKKYNRACEAGKKRARLPGPFSCDVSS